MKNNKNCFKRAKMGEHTFFATFFIFFSSRTEKCSFSKDVFWIPPTFSPLTSLHYSRFGSLRLPRGAVTSSARPPQRGPRPSLRTPQPLAPDSTTLRSFRSVSFVPKSRSVSKKVFENEHFFCSLVGKKKRIKERLLFFAPFVNKTKLCSFCEFPAWWKRTH